MKFVLIAWVTLLPGKYHWKEIEIVDTPQACIQLAKDYKIAVYRCELKKEPYNGTGQ